MTLRLRYTALSDVGRVRKDNQDSGYAGPHLLAVADGVGGSARGDVASATAIDELKALDIAPEGDVEQALALGIEAAHRKLAELVDTYPELDGTSTTVTAAIFDGTRLGVGHVGDSRGYLLHDGRLTQITKDHTFVQSLIDEGRITEPESRVHPHRHLILKAVDGVHDSDPDLFYVDLAAGDRILLCSDGASGSLDDTQLAALLADGTVEKAAVDLVRESLEAGSTDNVTVIVADVVDGETEDPDETQGIAIGPVVVGAATEKRKGLSKRRPKRADTGEMEPIQGEDLPPGGIVTDPESIRYAPREPHRFTWIWRTIAVGVVMVLLYLGGSAAYRWSQRQYFVGQAQGNVAIWKGVSADIPVVTLRHVYQRSDTRVADLPSFYRSQVRDGMSADSLANARATVRRLEREAACPSSGSTPSATPTPTPTPTPGATPTTPPTTTPTTTPAPVDCTTAP